MNYGQILTRVKERCSITNESQFDASVLDYVNDGLMDVATRYLWPFLLASETLVSVAGTDTYFLQNPCVVDNVRDTTNLRILRGIDHLDFDRYFPFPTATGVPDSYREVGSGTNAAGLQVPSLSLYPIPAGAYQYQVKGYRAIAPLVAATDIPNLPPPFHLILVHYAASVFWMSRGDARMTAARDDYENGLAGLAEQYKGASVDESDVLRSTDEAYDVRVLQLPPFYPSSS